MEIVPGLHRLEVPIPNNPLGHVNVYAIHGEDSWTIVDTGFDVDDAYRSLIGQIRGLTADVSRVDRIVVTHWHPDHFGLAHRLKADSGAQIVMHQYDVEFVNSIFSDRARSAERFAGWLKGNGTPAEEVINICSPPIERTFASAHRFEPDVALLGGEKLKVGRFHFDVIWTPGHAPGHVCLHEARKRLLIAGDHVLPSITPNVSYYPQAGDNPLAAFLGSLDSLARLDVALVLPAHEQPFVDLRGRIKEMKKHHFDRCEAILAAVGDVPKTAYEASSDITWADGLMLWGDMPVFHRRMAVAETLAHLQYLRSKGSVEVASSNGKEMWGKIATAG